MPDRLLAPAATAALFFLTTTAVSAETPGKMSAEQGWSSIARCAQEETEHGRHTCLDRVLQDAGLLTDDMRARQQRRAFGLDERAARALTPPAARAASPQSSGSSAKSANTAGSANTRASANAAAPANTGASANTAGSAHAAAPAAAAPAASAAPPRTAAPAAGPATAAPTDRLEVELAKVEKAANGSLFVTTTDGAVWLQTESVAMPQPPMAGDRMTIRKGSMAGYRCSVVSTHLTYRCARSR